MILWFFFEIISKFSTEIFGFFFPNFKTVCFSFFGSPKPINFSLKYLIFFDVISDFYPEIFAQLFFPGNIHEFVGTFFGRFLTHLWAAKMPFIDRHRNVWLLELYIYIFRTDAFNRFYWSSIYVFSRSFNFFVKSIPMFVFISTIHGYNIRTENCITHTNKNKKKRHIAHLACTYNIHTRAIELC